MEIAFKVLLITKELFVIYYQLFHYVNLNNFTFSYSLLSTENNLNRFLEQERKTGLIKISSSRYLIVEPSSRVTLRNRKILQILRQIIKCLE